jgi:IS30 family transposase
MKLSYRSIGGWLNKHHSTISPEVARNSPSSGPYCDKVAQKAALTRWKRPRQSHKQSNEPLANYVVDKLTQDWSPETISGRLKIYWRRKKDTRVSPDTIHQWVCRDLQRAERFISTHFVDVRKVAPSGHMLRSVA